MFPYISLNFSGIHSELLNQIFNFINSRSYRKRFNGNWKLVHRHPSKVPLNSIPYIYFNAFPFKDIGFLHPHFTFCENAPLSPDMFIISFIPKTNPIIPIPDFLALSLLSEFSILLHKIPYINIKSIKIHFT